MQDPYTRNAAFYTASEIGTSGTITSIGWNINKIWSNGDGPVKIYLKDNAGILSSDTWANIKNGATLVYNNTVTFPTSANNTWFTINLTTPFNYTSGNLLVLVESNYGGSGNGGLGGDIDFNCTAGMSGKVEFWWGNPIQTTGTVSDIRPILQLTFNTVTDIGTLATTDNAVFSIYPNPATQMLNYSLTGTENAEIVICNLEGMEVFSERLSDSANGTIDISSLPKGCYIVKMKSALLNRQEKLIIQ
jgi:hypothetical protein